MARDALERPEESQSEMVLVEIGRDGSPVSLAAIVPQMAKDILEETRSLCSSADYVSPWTAHFAVSGDEVVGYCCFKSAPANGTVEIAYATMPGLEGKGIATSMASRLIERARSEIPEIDIIAHTLPEENASTTVLRKLGFEYKECLNHPDDGEVWQWRLLVVESSGVSADAAHQGQPIGHT